MKASDFKLQLPPRPRAQCTASAWFRSSLGVCEVKFLWGLILGAWGFAASAAAVYETAGEFLTSGDFNGDGRADVLVLDKLTGNARIGYQNVAGGLDWSQPLPTGADPATALAVGRFAETNRDVIAVTAAGLNRIQVVSLADPSNAPAPNVVYPPHADVSLLVGLDAPYGATAERTWLSAGAHDPGLTLLDLLAFAADGDASFQDQVATEGFLSRATSFRRAANDATLLAAIRRDGSNDTFVAFAYTNTAAPVLVRSNLPPGVEYVSGNFNNEPYPRLLFYVPGESNVIAQPLVNAGGAFSFGTATVSTLPMPVRQLYYVDEQTNGLVLVWSDDGVITGLRLSGSDEQLHVSVGYAVGPAGNEVTGVTPLGLGKFALLSGGSNLLSSATAQVFTRNAGGDYVQTSSNTLSSVSTPVTRGNVWVLTADPFGLAPVMVLESLSAPDWSSGISYSPGFTTRAETDGGPATGLGNLHTNNLSGPPTGTGYVLPNQYRPDVSFFSSAPARPEEPSLVQINPPPGPYPGPIQISFSTLNLGDEVYYRQGASAPWELYASTGAFYLTNTTTIEYYGTALSGARSRSQFATYTLASTVTPTGSPVTLPGSDTNPPPALDTNRVILSARGTVFYSRHTAAAELEGLQGPSAYSSFADSPFDVSGYAPLGPTPSTDLVAGPMSGSGFRYFYLEDFEDGNFNTPGATPSAGWGVANPGVNTDSVDADDGSINGSGAGGHSYYSGGTQTNLTITFNAVALGGHLPTHAGIVFTDIGNVLSGAVGHGNALFTARDANGVPLGTNLGLNLGDGPGGTATAEDRFFGVVNAGGISSISITMTNSKDWEVDHLQFGYLADFNDTTWAINLDGSGETFITDGARPRVSRDAQRMAFLRGGGGVAPLGNIWARDLTTGQETIFYTNQAAIQAFDWSGTNLVFDNSCLLFSGPAGGPFTQLPLALTPECYDEAPVVNPADGRLAFHNSNPGAPHGVYVTSPDWTTRTWIAEPTTLRLRWPAWSPDGTRLLMADQSSPMFINTGVNLWTANADGSNLRQITALIAPDGFPHGAIWTPDGRGIVGAGTIGGVNGLWVVPLESDGGACHCPPRLLPTSAGSAIDFVGSALTAPAPLAGPRPDLFIRTETNVVVVYWSTNFDGYSLEFTTNLAGNTWSPISGPYYLAAGNYEYREARSALAADKFFRLHYPGVFYLTPSAWMLVPAEPTLAFAFDANQAVLTWPLDYAGYTLEVTTNLTPPIIWVPLNATFSQTNGHFEFRSDLSKSKPQEFFRLRGPQAGGIRYAR